MQHSYFAGFLVYVIFNGALVFSSVYIVTQYAPAAAGSGIPEIKGYLNGKLIFTRNKLFSWTQTFTPRCLQLPGIDTPGILLFRTLVGKVVMIIPIPVKWTWLYFLLCIFVKLFSPKMQIFGSIGSVGGGLALGKEGPLVHTGACIASLVGQVSKRLFQLPWAYLPKLALLIDISRRQAFI